MSSERLASNVMAWTINEIHGQANAMMSIDYCVIDRLLFSDYAEWSIRFARNTTVFSMAQVTTSYKSLIIGGE